MKSPSPEKATWLAMNKLADGGELSDQEWRDLSALSLIDRTDWTFRPGNCRWAKTEQERQSNEEFYKAIHRATDN